MNISMIWDVSRSGSVTFMKHPKMDTVEVCIELDGKEITLSFNEEKFVSCLEKAIGGRGGWDGK